MSPFAIPPEPKGPEVWETGSRAESLVPEPTPLKVLIVEDNPLDRDLIVQTLCRAGFAPDWRQVDTEPDYLTALAEEPELVLSDYRMPSFDGLRALELLQGSRRDIPFILVSGTIGEETAVIAMKNGAADYLLKDRLTRLGPAVRQALDEGRHRRERRQIDEQLRASEERFRLLAKATNDAIWDWDVTANTRWWNEGLEKLFGYGRTEEPTAKAWTLHLHPDDRDRVTTGIQRALDLGADGWQDEYRFQCKDGHYAAVLDRGHIIRDADGQVVRMIGGMTDQTERKRAEADLRWKTTILEAHVDSSNDGILVTDPQGRKILQNQRTAELFAIPSAAAVNPDDREQLGWVMNQMKEPEQFLVRVAHLYAQPDEIGVDELELKNGMILSRYSSPVVGKDGKNYGRLWNFRDITERKGAERILRESEEKLRQLIENVSDIIAVIDPTGVIVYQSPSTQRVLGYEPAEVIGHRVLEFIHPEDREKAMEGIRRALAGQPAQAPLDYRMKHSDGTWRIFQSNGRAYTDPTGAVRVVVTSHDITDTRTLEQQFLRAQRLEAIGTLSSGIAHDLNNILAPILLIASMLKESLCSPHDLEMLAMVEQSAQRGANVIKQLLTFSRGIEGDRGPIQLRHLLKEMTALMQETFPRDITILQQISPDLVPVNANATQIHQVLLNLCVNARDAMPGGGTLTLAAQNVAIGEKEAAVEPLATPGAFVCLSISDTGVGIPSANLVRMFEPFFTTKEIGKGTGLGLSTVLGIVKSHGGFVTVASEPGRGTTFKVHLPALGEQRVTVAPEDLAAPRGKQELILVVDDEAALRHALCLTLADANYRVLAAADGREAVNLFLAHRSSIRLVLTDLMMPGISGLALIRTLRALEPNLRFVASSGLHDQARRDELTALGVKSFLPKPSSPEEILLALHRELSPGT